MHKEVKRRQKLLLILGVFGPAEPPLAPFTNLKRRYQVISHNFATNFLVSAHDWLVYILSLTAIVAPHDPVIHHTYNIGPQGLTQSKFTHRLLSAVTEVGVLLIYLSGMTKDRAF